MRADQIQRMTDLQSKLVEAFLREGNPDEWPGAGQIPKAMSKDDRGDQYWCKKNAAATLAIVVRVQLFLTAEKDGAKRVTADDGNEEVDLESQQRQAEKDAQLLIGEMQRRVGAVP